MFVRRIAGRSAKSVRIVVINIFMLCFLLVLVEGFSSYVLFFRDVTTTYPVAERLHTRYDGDLGWTNTPNVQVADIYGPGSVVRVNGQGFRNYYDFGVAVPAGKYRVICSGDSFTFGYGVSNNETWCYLLQTHDRQLESVNMGEGGYGADQAYLWFRRDGVKFQHQVHLFAVITDDFRRMQSKTFQGYYGKPVIGIENGSLVVRNVPVPRLAYNMSWFISNISNIQHLRTIAFLQRAVEKLGLDRTVTKPQSTFKQSDDDTKQVLRKIFGDLKRLNEEGSAKLVLVYLPTLWELDHTGSDDWMKFVEEQAAAQEIPLINVLHTFRLLPQATNMFIPDGQLKYPGAARHLNVEGNKVVAQEIYDGLRKGDL